MKALKAIMLSRASMLTVPGRMAARCTSRVGARASISGRVSGSKRPMSADAIPAPAATVNAAPKPASWYRISPTGGPTTRPTQTATA